MNEILTLDRFVGDQAPNPKSPTLGHHGIAGLTEDYILHDHAWICPYCGTIEDSWPGLSLHIWAIHSNYWTTFLHHMREHRRLEDDVRAMEGHGYQVEIGNPIEVPGIRRR